MRRLGLRSILVSAVSAALPLVVTACSDSSTSKPMPDMAARVDPFKPVPECAPGSLAVTPFKGDRVMLISSLSIASFCEGFDLVGDGKAHNKLAPIGSLANQSIADSFNYDHNLVVPIEVFGYGGKDTECTKFAFYLGRVNEDKDGDGADTSWKPDKADCDDTNPATHPGAPEIPDRMDNDCDGFADNPKRGSPPTDEQDLDGDGFSLKQGDCDDRPGSEIAKARHPGAKEVCGAGIDFNCDGIPGNAPECDPFKSGKGGVHVTTQSFAQGFGDGGVSAPDGGTIDPSPLKPLIVFADGKVQRSVLAAGPDLFELAVPIDGSTNLKLTLNGVHVAMFLDDQPGGTSIPAAIPGVKNSDKRCPSMPQAGGLLGGVLEAVTMAQIKNLDFKGIIDKSQSLFDAVFVGPVASTVLGLDADNDGHYMPDIDVDGDGLESFWDSNPVKGMPSHVDTCKDGDGTIVKNNFDGKGTPCVMAKDAKGNNRFVDGISVALKFTAVPAKLIDVVQK